MNTFLSVLFFVCLFIPFYAYVGYGMLIFLLVKLKRIFKPKKNEHLSSNTLPKVSLVIAAYNEEDFIVEKLSNTEALNYPQELLEVIFVTDGSSDKTMDIIANHGKFKLFHENERKGKIAAVNRVLPFVENPVVIFCDANTLLNTESIQNIVRHFNNPKVGCVAGEKKIMQKSKDTASAAGEGLYWKYESFLKKLDSEFHTVVGAAGELFAVRRELISHVDPNIIIEDFVISLQIAGKGYQVVYEPEAYAIETSSENIKEELKRKIRICAGGIQAIVILKDLLNPLKHGWLTFQYVSHRVLRWTIVPFLLAILIPLNIYLAFTEPSSQCFFKTLLFFQFMFYAMALTGWAFAMKEIKVKALFVPYYFFIMNLAVFFGINRYLKGKQSSVWEKAKRAKA